MMNTDSGTEQIINKNKNMNYNNMINENYLESCKETGIITTDCPICKTSQTIKLNNQYLYETKHVCEYCNMPFTLLIKTNK